MARGDCRGARDRLGALGFEHADPDDRRGEGTLQVRHHLGYEPDADDRHELRRLAQRFGMELSAPFEASN